MRPNFDEIIDRTKSQCAKWSNPHVRLSPAQAAADPLPMWVADMDFRAPDVVIEALSERVGHGVFGYSAGPSKSYLDAVLGWQKKRFDWEPDPESLVVTSGVLATLKTIVQTFSQPGDSVLIQTPVYGHFLTDVLENGRRVVEAPLIESGAGYFFDAQVFEAAIRPNTRIFILCNPHNPTGNIWTEDELCTMGEICMRHDILVVSDEIHQDFILNPDRKHIPFAKLGPNFADNCIICTAPSKTFNIAGLQCANAFVPNPRNRMALKRQMARNQFPLNNVMGLVATETAYIQGEAWLEDLLVYLQRNHDYLTEALKKTCPEVKVVPTDSLFLSWLDFRALKMPQAELNDFLLIEAGLWLNDGMSFGSNGRGFMRMNLGCPLATVNKAVIQLETALRKFRQ